MAVCTEFGMRPNLRSGRQGNRVLSSATGWAGAWQRWRLGGKGGATVGRLVGQ